MRKDSLRQIANNTSVIPALSVNVLAYILPRNERLRKLEYYFAASGLFNAAWLLCRHCSRFALSVVTISYCNEFNRTDFYAQGEFL